MYHARNLQTLTKDKRVYSPDVKEVVLTLADRVFETDNEWIVNRKEYFSLNEWKAVFPSANIRLCDTSVEEGKKINCLSI